MILRHQEFDIPEDNPFQYCKLARTSYASILTKIISKYADGFVLAINSEWGTGKSTFIKMWKRQLENEGFRTLFFNAWENDFEGNPLIALLSELKTFTKKDDKLFKSLVAKGAIVTKNILPGLLKAIAGAYVDTGSISEMIEKSGAAAAEILKDEVDEYAKRKKGLKEFKDELTKYVMEHGGEKPIVIMIDELDRCRPSYSVEVLEQVKHFFSVPGIIFVLSIDKQQLAGAVKGFYGSHEINATEYLRRFIDLEYTLPEPPVEDFCKYLFDRYEFGDFLGGTERSKYQEFRNEKSDFIYMCTKLFTSAHLSLRQQERIFVHGRIALTTFRENQYIVPSLFVFLIYIRFFHSDLYGKMKMKNLPPQELLNELRSVYPPVAHEDDIWELLWVEVALIYFYANSFSKKSRKWELTERDAQTGKEKVLLNFSFESSFSKERILDLIESHRRKYDYLELDFFLRHIDLTYQEM